MGQQKDKGRDPFNQNSDRSVREKRATSKGGPVFSKLFRLDRTDPLSFGPKFPEILVEWIAPKGGETLVHDKLLGLLFASFFCDLQLTLLCSGLLQIGLSKGR